MITHVVLMTFREPSDRLEAKAKLEALVGAVPTIESLRVHFNEVEGPVASHLMLVSTYADLDALAAYQSHPAHLNVAAWLRERLVARAACDTSEALL